MNVVGLPNVELVRCFKVGWWNGLRLVGGMV